MRFLFSLALIGIFTSLSAQEVTYPYNPDANDDQYVAVSDVLSTISAFGSGFLPEEIQIGGIGLAEVINQLIANQNALQFTVDAQQAYISELQQYISIEPEKVLITGANLQVVSGGGETHGTVNGTGNIIIGYDEDNGDNKSGSHNLVVGMNHTYSSWGGVVGGRNNSITDWYCSVLGGEGNTAGVDGSCVSGGYNNSAVGLNSSVSGGRANSASAQYSSVSGGSSNNASGYRSSISGGHSNIASGDRSSVSGGTLNTASGYISSFSGDVSYQQWVDAQGYLIEETDPIATLAGYLTSYTETDPIATNAGYATEPWVINQGYSTGGGVIAGLDTYLSVDETTNTVLISGANLQVVNGEGVTFSGPLGINGKGNIIIGYDEDNGDDKSGSHNLIVGMEHTYSSWGGIVGGRNNSISEWYSSIIGGEGNTADGVGSSVSGGYGNFATGVYSSVTGGSSNVALGTMHTSVGDHMSTYLDDFSIPNLLNSP